MSKDIFADIPSKVKDKSVEYLNVTKINTALGDLIAIADDDYLYLLSFVDGKKIPKEIEYVKNQTSKDLILRENDLLLKLKSEMEDYFKGKLKTFKTPVKYFGTDFQKETWDGLSKLKYGEFISYSQLASRLGRGPGHSRAVGACAGANPLVIIIPCHRLIAAHGKQGGFSCGANRKKFLIDLEKKNAKACVVKEEDGWHRGSNPNIISTESISVANFFMILYKPESLNNYR